MSRIYDAGSTGFQPDQRSWRTYPGGWLEVIAQERHDETRQGDSYWDESVDRWWTVRRPFCHYTRHPSSHVYELGVHHRTPRGVQYDRKPRCAAHQQDLHRPQSTWTVYVYPAVWLLHYARWQVPFHQYPLPYYQCVVRRMRRQECRRGSPEGIVCRKCW